MRHRANLIAKAAVPKADGEAKRSRKKATKEVVNAQDELLNDLVQLARAEPVVSVAVQAKSPEKVAEPVKTPEPVKAAKTEKPVKAEKPVKVEKAKPEPVDDPDLDLDGIDFDD